MKAHKRSRGIVTLSLTSALDGRGGVKATAGQFYPQEREAVPIVQEDTFDMHKHSKTILSLSVLAI